MKPIVDPVVCTKQTLADEVYHRLGYHKKVVYEVIWTLFDLMHEKVLEKKAIRLFRIGTIYPKVRHVKTPFKGKNYDTYRIRFAFKPTYQFASELTELSRRENDDQSGRTAEEAQDVPTGSGDGKRDATGGRLLHSEE